MYKEILSTFFLKPNPYADFGKQIVCRVFGATESKSDRIIKLNSLPHYHFDVFAKILNAFSKLEFKFPIKHFSLLLTFTKSLRPPLSCFVSLGHPALVLLAFVANIIHVQY